FVPDSALEGGGFEPSVPLPSTDVSRRDREFDVSALQGRLSTSSQGQCSTDPGLIAGTWHRPLFLTRDRWFESASLQRRVCLSTRSRLPLAWHDQRSCWALVEPGPSAAIHRTIKL